MNEPSQSSYQQRDNQESRVPPMAEGRCPVFHLKEEVQLVRQEATGQCTGCRGYGGGHSMEHLITKRQETQRS